MITADWRPAAPLHVLKARAELLAGVRAFFARRDVLEVETPVLAQTGVTDPALSSFSVTYKGPGAPTGRRLYLQTSPEFAMKRLLAAGSGDIYQLSRVFRDGEAGRLHNPEFTLLEWYRVGYDHWRLMNEIEALVSQVYPSCPKFSRESYGDLFRHYLGIDPLVADEHEAAEKARHLGLTPVGGLDRDGWLNLLFTHLIEPELALNGAVFVHGFPASQAALARLDPADQRVSERFELYINGVELANGFHELSDAAEQRRRFEGDLRRRQALGLASLELDERLLAALTHGLPDCSGVALGLDRLLMLITGVDRLSDVLAFPLGVA